MEYIGRSDFVDTDYVLGMTTMEEFIGIHREIVDRHCMDISDKVVVRVTDEQARVLIRKITKCDNASEFQELDIAVRDKCLKKLREKGVSIRQPSRLTGISYGVVRKF